MAPRKLLDFWVVVFFLIALFLRRGVAPPRTSTTTSPLLTSETLPASPARSQSPLPALAPSYTTTQFGSLTRNPSYSNLKPEKPVLSVDTDLSEHLKEVMFVGFLS
ncbi:hypothetical protein ACFX2I_028844 [Malus domestica]